MSDAEVYAKQVVDRDAARARYLNLARAPAPLQALMDGAEAELVAAGGDDDDIRLLRQRVERINP